MISRRSLLSGVAASALCRVHGADAGLRLKGNLAASAPPAVFSQRSILNMNYPYDNERVFIDAFRQSLNFPSPFGSAYLTGTPVYNRSILDTNGWPTSLPNGNVGCGFILLPSALYSGNYICDGSGEGTFSLTNSFGTDTWTVISKTSNVTVVSNGVYSVTDSAGTGWSITLSFTETTVNRASSAKLQLTATNPNSNGKYLGYGGLTGRPTMRFYAAGQDATDLASGLIFRSAFKNMVAANNPSALRFMIWHGGNAGDNNCSPRWSQRQSPNISSPANWLASPPYTSATFSGTPNVYTLASATGMPVSYQQAELVQFRCDTTATNFISSFSGASPTAVVSNGSGSDTTVTLTGHPFVTGQNVFWRVATGMVGLDYLICQVTTTTTNTFNVNIDTSSQPSWVFNSGNNFVNAIPTLNVGGRGAAYVFQPTGELSPIQSGSFVFTANTYGFVTYDKYLGYRTIPGGAFITPGVWLTRVVASGTPFVAGFAVELCVALVNEINALYTTQGPTHLWINMPYQSLMSVDPDYTVGENYPVQAINAILNGGTYSGVTYAGLTAKAQVIVEHSNETWDGAPGFSQTQYLDQCGVIRNGQTVGSFCTFKGLRAAVMVNDIKTAFPGNTRIKHTIGAQGPGGCLSNGYNYQLINGNQLMALDPWNTWGNVWQGTAHTSGTSLIIDSTISGSPQVGQKLYGATFATGDLRRNAVTIISGSGTTWTLDTNLGTIATESMQASLPLIVNFDAMNTAIYCQSSTAWETANLSTQVTNWVNAGRPAADPSIDAYLVGYISSSATQSVSTCETNLSQFSVELAKNPGNIASKGTQYIIGYEGEWSDSVNVGQNYFGVTLTSDQSGFLIACKQSLTWQNAWLGLLNYYATLGNGAMPGVFTVWGSIWEFADPLPLTATLGLLYPFSGTTEYGDLDVVWAAMGTRNSALP